MKSTHPHLSSTVAAILFGSSLLSFASVISVTETGQLEPERAIVENGGDGVFDPTHAGINIADGVLFGAATNTFVDRNHMHADPAFDAAGTLSTTGAEIVPLPDYLVGNEYIRLPNDAKNNNPYSVTVTTDVVSEFFLLLDNRADGPANTATSPNSTEPVLGGTLQWVIDAGWERVNTGISPNGQPDYTSIDESNDGTLNQFFSIWVLTGTSATIERGVNGNMHSMVIAPAPDPEAPISSFAAVPSTISAGGSAELVWVINADATLGEITPVAGDILPDTDIEGVGSLDILPEVSTTYTLSVETPEGDESRETRIEVRLIDFFTSDETLVNSGDPVTLSWMVRPDATVSISGLGDVTAITDETGAGSTVVNPTEITTYILTADADDAAGDPEMATAEVGVSVIPDGTPFALMDIGATDGRPEPGALGGAQVGAAANGINATNLPLTTLTSETGVDFTITIDNVDPTGAAVGNLDWRDRGDGPGEPQTLLVEDFVKNNGGMVRVTLGGLPSGQYDVVSYHLDPGFDQCESIAISVTDADGTAVDTGVLGSAFVAPVPLVAGLTTVLVTEHIAVFSFVSDGLNDVILYFDGRGAVDTEVPLSALQIVQKGGTDFRITEVRHVPGSGEVSFDFTSRPGADYLIEASGDGMLWNELDDAFPSGGEMSTFTETGLDPEPPTRIYRVREN